MKSFLLKTESMNDCSLSRAGCMLYMLLLRYSRTSLFLSVGPLSVRMHPDTTPSFQCIFCQFFVSTNAPDPSSITYYMFSSHIFKGTAVLSFSYFREMHWLHDSHGLAI